MLEYHANRNVDYARDVFNAGLKKFIGEPTYVLHYLRFLIQLNEDNSTHARTHAHTTRTHTTRARTHPPSRARR
jgi:cleavage stimulation factor subunit 3